jgi:tetratricopeptide (TPR) repeat protein
MKKHGRTRVGSVGAGRAGLVLLAAATLLAYLPAMRGGYIWDDDDYVTENLTLRSADGLRRIWFELGAVPQYYPLVHTTYWLEYRLWGLNPAGYHVTNILLHAANAVLVVLILTRLGIPGAWLAGAIFALHPVHVESVAWITERKNVLSGLFYLSSLLVYLRFSVSAEEPSASRGSQGTLYSAALLLFAAALLSKTVTATLPAAILVIVWWKRGRLALADVRPLLPMFVAGLAMSSLTGWMERYHVGARGPAFDWNLADRVLIAGRTVWFYAARLFWPHPLVFVYPRWEIEPSRAWQWLFPLSALAVPVALWLLRGRIGRGPLAAALYFGGTLVPALGFVNVYPMIFSYVADHFQYLASLGLISLAAAVWAALWGRAEPTSSQRGSTLRLERLDSESQTAASGRRLPKSPALANAGSALTAVLLLVLATLTWRQAQVYTSAETLWRDTLAKNPHAALAYHNLGILLRDRGELAEARRMLTTAIDLRPGFAESYNALGRTLELEGRHEEAIEQYRRAVEINPRDLPAHYNWGNALRELGRFPEAEQQYRQALNIDPQDAPSQLNLAVTLTAQKRFEESLPHYEEALRLNPRYGLAHHNLALTLSALGRTEDAIRHMQQAVELDPANHLPRFYLALLWARQGNRREAVQHLQTIVQQAPDFRPAVQALEELTDAAPD